MSENPYQAPYVPYGDIAAQAAVDQRATFIRNTYLHLLGAILAFAAIDAVALTLFNEQIGRFSATVTSGYSWLLFMGAFMVVSYIADRWAHSDTSRSMQYLGLGLYVVAQAVLFLPLLYVAERFAPDTIVSAGIVTAVVFGGLTFVVFFTKADFSFLRSALCVGGMVALALIVASIVLGFPLGIWFSIAMILMASGSILYSTSNVLHSYRTSQYVAASLSLFASVALMLWYVLRLFMSFDE
jgi:FtsH-binding integral membrane protein